MLPPSVQSAVREFAAAAFKEAAASGRQRGQPQSAADASLTTLCEMVRRTHLLSFSYIR